MFGYEFFMPGLYAVIAGIMLFVFGFIAGGITGANEMRVIYAKLEKIRLKNMKNNQNI